MKDMEVEKDKIKRIHDARAKDLQGLPEQDQEEDVKTDSDNDESDSSNGIPDKDKSAEHRGRKKRKAQMISLNDVKNNINTDTQV